MDRNIVHMVYYGMDLEMRGLYLDQLDKYDLSDPNQLNTLKLIPGHRYIVLYNDNAKGRWDQPHQILEDQFHVHYGPRNENFYDYSRCDYLTTRDGIYFKFIYKRYEWSTTWLDAEQYESILPNLERIQTKLKNAQLETGISKRTGKAWYRLSFQKLREVGDDIRDFCEKDDYIKPEVQLQFSKRIRTIEEIKAAMDYFCSKPKGEIHGFDYETHGGFPFESDEFEPVGLGIANIEDASAAYFDLQWMIHEGKNGEYDYFKDRLRDYLELHEDSVTYNNAFEQKVTYLILHKLCLFDEGATANKVDGFVEKRFTLKYTVQRCLHLRSWDDDFDKLNEELPKLWEWNDELKDYKWKITADGENEILDHIETDEDGNEIRFMKSVPNDYKHNPVWKWICDTYPEEVSEFEHLIEKYYGDSFACIPSNLQTYYCCRDAFYTGLLKKYCLDNYSELCYQTYNSNLKFEALLHLTGCYVDMEARDRMELQCLWMEVYGKLNVCKWAVDTQLKWFKDVAVPEVPIITQLIREGYDPFDSKTLLMSNLDDSEIGFNMQFFKDHFGDETAQIFYDTVKEYFYRIDDTCRRSRKCYEMINEQLTELYKPEYNDKEGYCKFTVNGVDYKVDLIYRLWEMYLGLERSKKMINIFSTQVKFSEINKLMLPHLGKADLPEKFTCNGEDYTLYDMLDWTDSVFNYKSINVSPYLKFMIYHQHKWLVNKAYLSDYTLQTPRDHVVTEEEFNSIPDADRKREWDKFGLPKIDEMAPNIVKYDEYRFKQSYSYQLYKLHGDLTYALYEAIHEEGLFKTKDSGERDEEGEPILTYEKEVQDWLDTLYPELPGWYDFMLRFMGRWMLSEDDTEWMLNHMDDIDISESTVQAMAKFEMLFVAAKKYDKILSTYINGHFTSYNCRTNEFDENAVSTDQSNTTGEYVRAFMPFYANEKQSKRWSSCWHTIPSKSEVKRCVTCPPGYIASYFDISGCEIRTISYKSGDPFMIDCYEKGLDPYITMAKFTFPDHADDYKYLKSWRSVFKMILLGLLYGMGVAKLAEMTELPEDHCQKVIDDLWKRCPVLKKFVEEKSQWTVDHPGFVESALGDKLRLDPDEDPDRSARLGINQFIQNYSSVSLVDGFYNCIAHSVHHDDEKIPNVVIMPLGVIHDSCQFYFQTPYLFRMQEYYKRNLTQHMYDIHGIYYEFDLLMFTNFFDEIDMKQLDDHHITFTSNCTALRNLVKKCREDGLKFKITKLTDSDDNEIQVNEDDTFGPEFKESRYDSILKEFSDYELYAVFDRDESKYNITFEELPGNPYGIPIETEEKPKWKPVF